MKKWSNTTILGVLAVAALILIMVGSIHPGPPRGWIPEDPPRAERRVVHPTGFSIVCPPGWFVKMDTNRPSGPDHINLRAADEKVRFAPRLFICGFDGAPNYLSNYHETVFLSMKAYERTVLRAGNGDYYTYELNITNRSRWYQILYQIPADAQRPPISSVPEMMLPYLQSFRPTP